jgi:hypothetical protein
MRELGTNGVRLFYTATFLVGVCAGACAGVAWLT